jgi:hypothetical protein
MAQFDNQDFEALAKDVRYMRDRLEIHDCILRYSRGLDRLDRDYAMSAYHADADDDRGAYIGTPSEFYDWVLPILEDARGTSHSITNITADIQGDVAHTESYITFHVWFHDDPGVIFGHARYLDRLERRNGRWAIAHRECVIDYRARLQSTGILPGELTAKHDRTDRSYLRPLGLSDDAKRRLAARKQA